MSECRHGLSWQKTASTSLGRFKAAITTKSQAYREQSTKLGGNFSMASALNFNHSASRPACEGDGIVV